VPRLYDFDIPANAASLQVLKQPEFAELLGKLKNQHRVEFLIHDSMFDAEGVTETTVFILHHSHTPQVLEEIKSNIESFLSKNQVFLKGRTNESSYGLTVSLLG
jgi:hypothetical protein